LRLYEYEAKQLLSEAKFPVPKGRLASSPTEARAAAEELGGETVLKVQILSGGRGKAGGIKFAESPSAAEKAAGELLGKKIKGHLVERLLVEERLDVAREYYLGVTIDRTTYRLVAIASAHGGVDIEETARAHPESIHRLHLLPQEILYSHQGVELTKRMGLSGRPIQEVGSLLSRLHRLFLSTDAKLLEVNPLIETGEGEFVCGDARMSIDEDALFRHPELGAMGITERHEEGELTPREQKARENGIPYLDLDGDIGMFPGGAGFGIMGNDFVTYYGGRPANFMDSGGGPTPERLATMLVLLDENPNVKAIFGARFGGISRCDDFARGVVMFLEGHGLSKPMAMRMTGNMWREGMAIFEKARKERPELFEHIEIHGIETPIEEVVKRAVALAKSAK
jgi:succinyl-CoA synthetase beta subunit